MTKVMFKYFAEQGWTAELEPYTGDEAVVFAFLNTTALTQLSTIYLVLESVSVHQRCKALKACTAGWRGCAERRVLGAMF